MMYEICVSMCVFLCVAQMDAVKIFKIIVIILEIIDAVMLSHFVRI